ncbi:hypothetical protein SUDANB70_01698 [Streptomyces sp. enrichment culture]
MLINRTGRAGKVRGLVGLWHETYVVPEGSYESVCADMPAFGRAAAHGQVPLERRGRRAKDRFAYRSGATDAGHPGGTGGQGDRGTEGGQGERGERSAPPAAAGGA